MKIVVGCNCGRCKVAERMLEDKGYKFDKIMYNSKEGMDIIEKTQLKELPIIIDDNGTITKGKEAVDFVNKMPNSR